MFGVERELADTEASLERSVDHMDSRFLGKLANEAPELTVGIAEFYENLGTRGLLGG